MHKCTLILCIITHLQHFSDDGMWQRRRTDVCGNRVMAPLFAVNSRTFRRLKSVVIKCVIIHNISGKIYVYCRLRINNVPNQSPLC